MRAFLRGLQDTLDDPDAAFEISRGYVEGLTDDRRGVLDASLDLFTKTDEDTIRLVIGQHTIIVQKEHGQTVAVVLPTGHAIAKSLRRMIRRLSKKERGPVQPPRPSTAAAGTTQAGPPGTTPGGSQQYEAA